MTPELDAALENCNYDLDHFTLIRVGVPNLTHMIRLAVKELEDLSSKKESH